MSCLAEIKRLIKLEIRKNLDLNQKIVAEKMGISSGYLSDLFRKEDMGGFQRIEQMCEAVGLNFADTVRRACAGTDVINMPFMDVRDFKNPDYFQTLRKKLLAFEQEAPDAYYTLLRHIEVDLTWARAKKKPKATQGKLGGSRRRASDYALRATTDKTTDKLARQGRTKFINSSACGSPISIHS